MKLTLQLHPESLGALPRCITRMILDVIKGVYGLATAPASFIWFCIDKHSSLISFLLYSFTPFLLFHLSFITRTFFLSFLLCLLKYLLILFLFLYLSFPFFYFLIFAWRDEGKLRKSDSLAMSLCKPAPLGLFNCTVQKTQLRLRHVTEHDYE